MKKFRHFVVTMKIMTALVVLNNADINSTITVGDEVNKAYGSAIYIKEGEVLTIKDLLYGLMLRSGNDAAIVLATNVAGSIPAFAILMNETAKSIGMKDTIFYNPHGLDEETENKSTVYDMALLMREAMKNKYFQKLTSTKRYTTKTNLNTYDWYNKNKLLTDYKYATGGKIGYTMRAKHTFVSSASKDGKNLIVATFVDSNRFITHANLYERYFDDYKKYNLIDKNNLGLNYKRGYKVFTLESFDMLLKETELNHVKKEVVFYNNIEVGKNATVIGNISISLNNTVYRRLNIYASKNEVKKKNIIDKIKDMLKW